MPYTSSRNHDANNSNVNNPASASEKRKPQTPQQLVRENVQYLIEQLEAGKSEALTAYLNAMARFRNYSFGNVLLIARRRAVTYCYTSLESMNIGGCASLVMRDGRHMAVRTNLTDLMDRK